MGWVCGCKEEAGCSEAPGGGGVCLDVLQAGISLPKPIKLLCRSTPCRRSCSHRVSHLQRLP